MKNRFTKAMALAAVLAMPPAAAQAQGFLGKLGKAAESLTSKQATTTQATQAATPELSDSAKAIRAMLLNVPEFTVKKMTLKGDDGKVITNADGTERYYYFITDAEGNAWDVATVKGVLKARRNLYGNILKKVGAGAVTGGLGGLLKGDLKSAATGAGVGALAGLGLSVTDIAQIRKVNKSLKKYDDMVEAYQQTITDEGLPKDAAANIADIDKALGVEGGAIDGGEIASLEKSLEEKESEVGKLEDFDFEELLK